MASANDSTVDTSVDSQPEQSKWKPTIYTWFVLFMAFLIRCNHQQNRVMIGYAFGYEGLGIQAGNPEYMIRAAYPLMVNYYGIIASFLFSLSYSTVGVFAGNLTKTVSRKNMLGVACIMWSLTTFGAG